MKEVEPFPVASEVKFFGPRLESGGIV